MSDDDSRKGGPISGRAPSSASQEDSPGLAKGSRGPSSGGSASSASAADSLAPYAQLSDPSFGDATVQDAAALVGREAERRSTSGFDEGELLRDRYRVGGVLASGGFSRVYDGLELGAERPVVIKLLTRSGSNDNEGRVLSNFQCNSIVTCIYCRATEKTSYLVMEKLEGPSLRADLVNGTSLSPDAVLRVARELSDALTALERKHVVHRDIKPENVLRHEDHFKLIDFGLCIELARVGVDESRVRKQAEDSEPVEAPRGRPVSVPLSINWYESGTKGYRAPEQIRGTAQDHRTDFWAFGVLIYEALTGKRPFSEDEAKATPGSPPEMAKVPAAFHPLLLKCLARDPNERPATATELRSMIEGAAARLSIATVEARHEALTNELTAAAAGVPVSDPIELVTRVLRSRSGEHAARFVQALATGDLLADWIASAGGVEQVWSPLHGLGAAIPRDVRPLLDEVHGFLAHHYLALRFDARVHALCAAWQGARRLARLPDGPVVQGMPNGVVAELPQMLWGGTVQYSRALNNVFVASSGWIQRLGPEGFCTTGAFNEGTEGSTAPLMALSPGGAEYVTHDRPLWIRDAVTHAPLVPLEAPPDPYLRYWSMGHNLIYWSTDGTRIFGRHDERMIAWDARTGRILGARELPSMEFRRQCVADGAILSGTGRPRDPDRFKRLAVIDPDTLQVVESIDVPGPPPCNGGLLLPTPDGTGAFVLFPDRLLRFRRSSAGHELAVVSWLPSRLAAVIGDIGAFQVPCACLSADGEHLFYVAKGPSVAAIRTSDGAAAGEVTVPNQPLSMCPGGDLGAVVVKTENDVFVLPELSAWKRRIWRPTATRVVVGVPTPPACPTPTQTGRWGCFAGGKGAVGIQDLLSLEVRATGSAGSMVAGSAAREAADGTLEVVTFDERSVHLQVGASATSVRLPYVSRKRSDRWTVCLAADYVAFTDRADGSLGAPYLVGRNERGLYGAAALALSSEGRVGDNAMGGVGGGLVATCDDRRLLFLADVPGVIAGTARGHWIPVRGGEWRRDLKLLESADPGRIFAFDNERWEIGEVFVAAGEAVWRTLIAGVQVTFWHRFEHGLLISSNHQSTVWWFEPDSRRLVPLLCQPSVTLATIRRESEHVRLDLFSARPWEPPRTFDVSWPRLGGGLGRSWP